MFDFLLAMYIHGILGDDYLESNNKVQTYNNTDDEFQKSLGSAAWIINDASEFIEDGSLSKRVSDLEKKQDCTFRG